MNRLRITPAAVVIIVCGFLIAVGFQNCAPSKLESLNGESKNSSATFASTETFSESMIPRAQDCIGNPVLSQLLACPSGQAGYIGQIRRVTSTVCPAGGGENLYTYSEWVNAANTCNTRCSGEPVLTQQVACPSGQSGTMTQTRTVDGVACGNNGVNIFTYSAWTTAGNQCSKACTGEPVLTQQVQCPSPFVGKINQRRVLHSTSCTATGAENYFSYGPWYEESSTCMQFSPPGPTRTSCTTADRTVVLTEASTNETFLGKVYCNLLNGYPDEEGFNFHLSVMSRGTTRAQILQGMAISEEYRARFPGFMNNSYEYYRDTYVIVGNRIGDESGIEFWRKATDQATTLEAKLKIAEEMLKGLTTSPNESKVRYKWGY